jgi:hypothetical protein
MGVPACRKCSLPRHKAQTGITIGQQRILGFHNRTRAIRPRRQKGFHQSVSLKNRGAHLLAPRYRHGNALEGTLSARPRSGRASSAVLQLEISRFVADSSRVTLNCRFGLHKNRTGLLMTATARKGKGLQDCPSILRVRTRL